MIGNEIQQSIHLVLPFLQLGPQKLNGQNSEASKQPVDSGKRDGYMKEKISFIKSEPK
jgi:hypothetical protein